MMKTIRNQIFARKDKAAIDVPDADKVLMRSLEPRIVLDGAGYETATSAMESGLGTQQADDYLQNNDGQDVVDIAQDSDAVALDQNITKIRKDSLVFIDRDVNNFRALLASIDPTIETVILDQDSQGIEQIADSLVNKTGLNAIHIIANDVDDIFDLGNQKISKETIMQYFGDEITIINNALSQKSDIMIYGNGDENISLSIAAEILSDTLSSDSVDFVAAQDLDDGSTSNPAKQSEDVLVEPTSSQIIANTIHQLQDLSRLIEDSNNTGLSQVEGGREAYSSNSWIPLSARALSENNQPVGEESIVFDLGDLGGDLEENDGQLNYDQQQMKAFIEGLEDRTDLLQFYFNGSLQQDNYIINIANNAEYFDDMVIKAYGAKLSDGSSLPEWIKISENGVIEISQQKMSEEVELIILVELENGETIERAMGMKSDETGLSVEVLNKTDIEMAEYYLDKV